MDVYGRSSSGRGNKCKGPEAGVCMGGTRYSMEDGVAGVELIWERTVGNAVREITVASW